VLTAGTASFGGGSAPIRTDLVRFEPDEPGLSLMVQTADMPARHAQRFRHVSYYDQAVDPQYSPVCEGPCATQLVPGAYHLALSKDGGPAVPAEEVLLQGPSSIHAEYEDHSAERVLGGMILVGGMIGGVAMVVVSAGRQTCDSGDSCTTKVDEQLLAGGIGVVLGSAILGTILAAQHDTAHVEVTPLALPGMGSRKEWPGAALSAAAPPQGVAVRVRF
jgi:hypothetical protein